MKKRLLPMLMVLLLTLTAVGWWRVTSPTDSFFSEQPDPVAAQQARIAQLKQEVLTVATPLHKKMAAVVLAEAWRGQEADIRWIYHNNVQLLGEEAGLKKSSAYLREKPWFKVWLTLFDDETYADDMLPDDPYTKGMTTREMCQTHYMLHDGLERGLETLKLVIEMDAAPETNPYPGWIGQGNIHDMNLSELYWVRARGYYWLQETGEVTEELVHPLAAGKYTQFLFDGIGIREFAEQNPELFDEPIPPIPIPDDSE